MENKCQSRFKIQRYLGVELPGLGKAGALERRPYRPGQHGSMRRKLSDYSIQLLEKQKLRFHYGLREYQLKNYVKKSKKVKGVAWIDTLIINLEKRLDNFIFRGHLVNSIASARQMITHGQVFVNGKKIDRPNYQLSIGDTISLSVKARKNERFLQAQESPRIPELPAYIESNKNIDNIQIKIIANPLPMDIPFEFDARLVTDFYSRFKV
jgi:small subunit ribosomal protein S4